MNSKIADMCRRLGAVNTPSAYESFDQFWVVKLDATGAVTSFRIHKQA
jgi:hypothetical protein